MYPLQSHAGSATPEDPQPPRRKKQSTVSPAIAGMVVGLAFLGREAIWMTVRHVFTRSPRGVTFAQSHGHSLSAMQAVLVGKTQSEIFKLLGKPRAATGGPHAVWYYPIYYSRQLAMAISFADDQATKIEFFHTP